MASLVNKVVTVCYADFNKSIDDFLETYKPFHEKENPVYRPKNTTLPPYNINFTESLKPENEDQPLPTLSSLLAERLPTNIRLGMYNESEYSGSIYFAKFQVDLDTDVEVFQMNRTYYKTKMELYYDSEKISTAPFEGSEMMKCEVITRLDRKDSTDAVVATTKIRMVRKEIHHEKNTVYLTGSIEVKFDRFPAVEMEESFKELSFRYWFVSMDLENLPGTRFRVAMRKGADYDSAYEMNIECEDARLTPHQYSDGFLVLAHYYSSRHAINEKVKPFDKCLNSSWMDYLSDAQKAMASTLKPCQDVVQADCCDINVKQFVKALGMKVLESYKPKDLDTLRCLDSLDRLTITDASEVVVKSL